MCCLDDVMNSNQERLQAAREKYIPSAFRDRKVFLYAPTWGPGASYIRRGFEILSALARSDAFVIVKPHPLCNTSEVGDSGYDLRTFLEEFFLSGNCLLVTDTPYEIMPITDMIISDFSSITFEYTLLRKPIMLFEGNAIYDQVSDRGQYEMLRECCFVFHENSVINRDTFTYRELSADKIAAMEQLQRRCFSHAGHATEIAVQKLAARGIIVPGKLFRSTEVSRRKAERCAAGKKPRPG
jgi:CDP-glycerol glycerophosphotransferase (TagB/SpsB family)